METATGWTEVTTADDVTDEVLDMVREIESGWYALPRPIDWEGLWSRLDGSTLTDGTRIDLGSDSSSAAMRKIRRVINAERRVG